MASLVVRGERPLDKGMCVWSTWLQMGRVLWFQLSFPFLDSFLTHLNFLATMRNSTDVRNILRWSLRNMYLVISLAHLLWYMILVLMQSLNLGRVECRRLLLYFLNIVDIERGWMKLIIMVIMVLTLGLIILLDALVLRNSHIIVAHFIRMLL